MKNSDMKNSDMKKNDVKEEAIVETGRTRWHSARHRYPNSGGCHNLVRSALPEPSLWPNWTGERWAEGFGGYWCCRLSVRDTSPLKLKVRRAFPDICSHAQLSVLCANRKAGCIDVKLTRSARCCHVVARIA